MQRFSSLSAYSEIRNEAATGRCPTEAIGTVAFVWAVLATFCTAYAADGPLGWPPSLDRENVDTKSLDGRRIDRFTHHSLSRWGYSDPQQNYCYVVHPKEPRENAPLCVVLHSANRTARDYLGYLFLNRKVDPSDDPADIGEHVPADFYTLFLDSNNDDWWGWSTARSDMAKYSQEPTATERRVLDTIEWAAAKYRIDRNRIYLTGISMGGCGSLGIAMPHGDVFAAVRVWVPAGTEYMACRMGFTPAPPADASNAQKDAWLRKISGASLPAPPVVVDFSAPNDQWSKDQGVLLNAAREGRLPLIVGWGPFGHAATRSAVTKSPLCAATLAFPWMEIRKNEAYAVFTDASSDQRAPWINKPDQSDESGQINAYFRWKSVQDTPATFAMRVWIEQPANGNATVNWPKESVANVSFRRLQQFQVVPEKAYGWELVREGRAVASGSVKADAAGLLTIPSVTITTEPAELRLKLQ